MKPIILFSILILSLNIVLADDTAVDEPVIIVEDGGPTHDVSYPFMHCDVPDKDSDFIAVTLMVNASRPETGVVVMMRNPKFDDLLKDDLSYDTDEDLTDFNFSPVAVTSNDLKIKKMTEDGKYEIAGGFVGFTTIGSQVIDNNTVKGQLKLDSVLNNESVTLNCSVYLKILNRVFQ